MKARKSDGLGCPLRVWPTNRPETNRIQDETILMPYMIADTVIGEYLDYWRSHTPPRYITAESAVGSIKLLEDRADEFATRLVEKAEICYANEQFYRKIKRKDGKDRSDCRETMYVFMKHWLAALWSRNGGDVLVDAMPNPMKGLRP
jgi:hypothetical protein